MASPGGGRAPRRVDGGPRFSGGGLGGPRFALGDFPTRSVLQPHRHTRAAVAAAVCAERICRMRRW